MSTTAAQQQIAQNQTVISSLVLADFGVAVIVVDRDHLEGSRVKMIVQAASIDTRNNHRDHVLRSDDFFDAARYPTLEFVSTRVTPKNRDQFEVAGNLTIRGVTKRIVVPVHYLGQKKLPGWGDFAGFETEFTIDRTEFGVNGTRWSGETAVLSREVTVHLVIGGMRRGSR